MRDKKTSSPKAATFYNNGVSNRIRTGDLQGHNLAL